MRLEQSGVRTDRAGSGHTTGCDHQTFIDLESAGFHSLCADDRQAFGIGGEPREHDWLHGPHGDINGIFAFRNILVDRLCFAGFLRGD